MRPDLRIVSRVNEAEWQQRISRAGADSPWQKIDAELHEGDVLVILGPDEQVTGIGMRLSGSG